MNTQNLISVLMGGLVTIVPQVIPMLPAEWRTVVTGLLGVAVSVWHLYQPAPKQEPPPAPAPVIVKP